VNEPAPAVPDVEKILVRDMLRRGGPAAPVIVAVSWLVGGADIGLSVLYAIVIVAVNLVLAALSLAWAARISPTALMATALGGFLFRMALLTAAVMAVKGQAWVSLPALAVAILLTHLALLFWETRYVSASLAYPALKPRQQEARTS
jgi:hypothetical protein